MGLARAFLLAGLTWVVGCGRLDFAEDRVGAPDAVAASCWNRWLDGTIALGAPQRIAELVSTKAQDNPSLSADGLTLYFERKDTSTDLYVTHRAAPDQPWGTPARLDALDSSATESRMTTSNAEDLAIFVSSRGGNTDLWSASRATPTDAFSTPSTELVAALNTSISELDPELGVDGLDLYYAPYDGTTQRILVAHRATTADSFTTAAALTELQISSAVADPSISPDQRVILFSSGATDSETDIYYARRSDRGAPFGSPTALSTLNVPGVHDGDVEISSDGCEVVFMSTRSGLDELYVSRAN